MIFRLSQKLAKKLKVGKLTETPLCENRYADWSCHLFTVDRTQYIMLCNTASLYSCLMYGRGITDDSTFVAQALETIRDFTADDGQQLIYRKFVASESIPLVFAKALNRSVTGSMNDHIQASKFLLTDRMETSEIGYRLNQTPMSALVDADGRKYSYPQEVFLRLSNRLGDE